jgi:hypothetical protein
MIAKLPFGKTGHASTRTLFGGAAISEGLTRQKADRLRDLLLEHGVNHIDTAPLYGNGNSEARIGTWMKSRRDLFFLATKTRERTYQEAWHSIRTSLKRLQVDYVDMIQLHNLTDRQEWELALGPEGTVSACVEARAATIASISPSLGREPGWPAASKTRGRIAASPAVFRKIPSWLSTQLTARCTSSEDVRGSYQVAAVRPRPSHGLQATDLIVCTATCRSAQRAARRKKLAAYLAFLERR